MTNGYKSAFKTLVIIMIFFSGIVFIITTAVSNNSLSAEKASKIAYEESIKPFKEARYYTYSIIGTAAEQGEHGVKVHLPDYYIVHAEDLKDMLEDKGYTVAFEYNLDDEPNVLVVIW